MKLVNGVRLPTAPHLTSLILNRDILKTMDIRTFCVFYYNNFYGISNN